MREIKFRAWIGYKMEYDLVVGRFGAFFVNPDENGDGRNPNDRACLSPLNTVLEHSPIMQYTGLKDKNGKETFSDDIVSDGINPPFVVDLWNWPLMIRLSEIEFEVIGNIYENPELLK